VPQPQDRPPDVPLNLIEIASQAFGTYIQTLTFEPLDFDSNYDQILSRRDWEVIVAAKYKRKGKKVLPQNVPLPDGINPGGGINRKDMTARILGEVGDKGELTVNAPEPILPSNPIPRYPPPEPTFPTIPRYPPPEPHLRGKTVPRGSRLTPARLANMKIGIGFLSTSEK
jgi:hypothetical protein